ncbi:T6SS effector phospholipase Tle3 domain-containing protein [Janthinobacterium sp. HLX7-2]|uniref:T6SS effector phospholipase Tle3 domain-containing protein n=1 Tax=Janthinobacterium sp. HLX7-2 TaxID=1259331 RepID=UPI003F29C76D
MGETERRDPFDPEVDLVVGMAEGTTLFSHCLLDCLQQMPSPGIIIFVHGVNSDGEWYRAAEEGLCKGLNTRMKRCDEHLCHATPQAGQLTPLRYRSELSDDGYVDPDYAASTFIQAQAHFSPVIQFRWGYKASAKELQKYGDSVYLNEFDYWGGGPFANGCSSLPDLWGEGLSDALFLFIHIEHLNPVNDRIVYACPPRPYFVLAALRLAHLVAAIRQQQADVPITLVCHSQGNMVGMAAAFLGNKMADVQDAAGKSGRCVADTYVLCNPPYSLLRRNDTEGWLQGQVRDVDGNVGRQSGKARRKTMEAFFDIVRGQAKEPPLSAALARMAANVRHDFTLEKDKAAYACGPQPSTRGRVTLYCNPHDQVISATPIQGIGWLGLCAEEIKATRGDGVFTQRVFAQGYPVGQHGDYDYWSNHYRQPKRGSPDFWFPHSPMSKYDPDKGVRASISAEGKAATVRTAATTSALMKWLKIPIHAVPPDDWRIPVTAPVLPEIFTPQAVRFGVPSPQFDQDIDPPGTHRHADKARSADDPYANAELGGTPAGNRDTEAGLRYEDHARLRMKARREKLYSNGAKVGMEDDLSTATPDYRQWRRQEIERQLVATCDTHATDHSTILTNPRHAEQALAYDVAIGVCHIGEEAMQELRVIADWRLLKELEKRGNSNRIFFEYFKRGLFKKMPLLEWVQSDGSTGGMPSEIVDERMYKRPETS